MTNSITTDALDRANGLATIALAVIRDLRARAPFGTISEGQIRNRLIDYFDDPEAPLTELEVERYTRHIALHPSIRNSVRS